jgi:glyoxylase-like metal-dependent hydrolase (beta-lactamase superfamily II)
MPANLRAVTIAIGNVQITPVVDAYLTLDARQAAVGVPPSVVAASTPGLVDEAGQMHLPVICHVLRSGGEVIVVDSGIGRRQRPGWPIGELDAGLRRVGVDPADVAIVVNSHMHGDHVGWNTVDDVNGVPRPFFPNARYVFQRTEWNHWIQPDRLAAVGNEHLSECVASLVDQANLDIVRSDAAISPELNFVPTPGHTPGHVAIGVSSSGERALIVGDATHYLGQLNHPDWSPAWDLDPVEAARTRSKLFEAFEGDPAGLLFTSHWPFPGAGRIVRVRGKRVFRPGA